MALDGKINLPSLNSFNCWEPLTSKVEGNQQLSGAQVDNLVDVRYNINEVINLEKKINELKGYETFEGYTIDEEGVVRTYIKRGYNGKGERFNWDYSKIVSPVIKSNGYLHLTITDGERKKSPTIHRLLALAFVPNDNNEEYVNHINGNKLDNRIENLEWVSFERNVNHSFEIGTNHRFKNGMNKEVDQFDLEGNYIKSYPSMTDAALAVGMKNSSKSAISKVCKGMQKTSGGYVWKYSQAESSTTSRKAYAQVSGNGE